LNHPGNLIREGDNLADKAVEAILFDLGQTLLEFSRLCSRPLFAVSAKNSYQWLRHYSQPVPAFWRYKLKHMVGLYLHLGISHFTGNDFDSLELLKIYGRRYRFTLNEEQYRELNWVWYEPLSKQAYVESDLPRTLDTLRAMGLKMGIVSNTFVNRDSLQRHLAQAGLAEFFPVQLYSCEFPWRKPDVRIYQAAAERIGVAPEKTLFVGDRVDTDVNGALAAGMIPVFKRMAINRDVKVPPGVITINKLAQLPAVVQKLKS
jgi:HAD superfamily hydrolase (TIGR01549 family)